MSSEYNHLTDDKRFRGIAGKPIARVSLGAGKDTLTIDFEDGSLAVFGVDGDCCSQSWIEHLTVPHDVEGQVITAVEDSDGVPWDGHECSKDCEHDHLEVYNTRFRTTAGDIVLEFRNDSNGYYGGSLTRVK